MALSGIGINSTNIDVKEKENQIESILAAINAQNKGLIEEDERVREEAEEQERKERARKEAEEEAKKNRERFDKEQEEKKTRKEEERKEREEQEKIKERNPFYATIKKFDKKKTDANASEEEEDAEEETETYASFIARNALEKSGDIIRNTKETLGKKKHDIVQSVTQKLSKIGGFEAPEFKEYNPSEEFAKRQEAKQIKKEEKEAKRKEMEEKRRLQREEQARIAQEKKEAAEQKKKEQELLRQAKIEAKKREAEALAAAEEKKKEEARLAAEKAAEERARAQQQRTQASAPGATASAAATPQPMTAEEYDRHLSDEARDLKTLIRKEHTTPDFSVTEHAVNEIQKMRDVVAVIIASADMNHLFIFHEPATFIELAEKLNKTMNYSYIYVVTTTAPVYFGSDRCYHGLTDLFNKIREIILRYGHVNRNVLLKVDGINVFKNIYLDA